MPSTYSPLKIELPATGEQSGTWGNTTNTNLGTALEEAITGSADVAFSSADVTVTLTDTNAAQTARNLRLNLTGTSGGARQLILGAGCQIEKLYLINNGLADAVTVKNTTGTGIAVPAGRAMFVYNNGTNVVEVLNTAINFLTGTLDATTLEVTNLRALDGTAAGSIANSTGVVTIGSSVLTTTDINGGTIDAATIGVSSPASGAFTSITASADSSFTSTGALQLSKGTTAERPSAVSGKLRFNTTTAEFEGYNGTAWASVGGAALVNDTTTASNLFPLFATATTGTAATLNTSNAKLLYKPSTGEFQSSELVASNGIIANSQTISASYTIAAGTNAMSTGPVTVASGQSVTVDSGSRWVVL
jgi:hypothetical protein